jgi:large subunit ribosomal protein L5
MSESTETAAKPVEPRLKSRYREQVAPELMNRYRTNNALAVPRLAKVVLSMGVGQAKEDPKMLEEAQQVLSSISGQKSVATRARKSVAGFQLRAGVPIGCKVTIRGARMCEFFDRLISIVLPRIRDFRGLSPDSFDGRGNYTLGITEHIVFPEVDPDAVTRIYGMNITICTTAKTDAAALELLSLLGMPFRR